MPRHRLTDDRGQSSIEYVAVLAVVAALVTAAGAATFAPTYVNAAWGGFQRALCIVTGRECRALEQQACAVRSNSESSTFTASIGVVRFEDGRLLLQERLSDGTIRITVTDRTGLGAEVEAGITAGVSYKGLKIDAGAMANASLLGLFGRGKTYVVSDAGAAQRLIRQVEDGNAREADVTFHEGGLRGSASASASAGASIGGSAGGRGKDDDGEEGEEDDRAEFSSDALAEVGADVQATLERAVGHRKDRRTGETTWYLRADNEVSASAGASVIAAGKAKAEAAAHANGLLSVTTDKRGRIVAVGGVGSYGAGAGYDVTNGPSGSTGGRRHEVEVTADPDHPLILDALRRFGREPGPGSVTALTKAIYEYGRIDRRSYEVDDDSEGIGGSVALGAKVGAGYEKATEQTRLVAASTRPPGGVWEDRFDCVDRA